MCVCVVACCHAAMISMLYVSVIPSPLGAWYSVSWSIVTLITGICKQYIQCQCSMYSYACNSMKRNNVIYFTRYYYYYNVHSCWFSFLHACGVCLYYFCVDIARVLFDYLLMYLRTRSLCFLCFCKCERVVVVFVIIVLELWLAHIVVVRASIWDTCQSVGMQQC